jgi:transporter family-2 protein
MNVYQTIVLLAAAGVAVVAQNILMVRITESVSNVLIALVINSSAGLTLLLAALLLRNGLSGVSEAIGAVTPWAILPGLLGSFFVFAGVMGYQKVGAASTVAVLVASQLIAGLLVDAYRAGSHFGARISPLSWLGAGLLLTGAVLVAHRRG